MNCEAAGHLTGPRQYHPRRRSLLSLGAHRLRDQQAGKSRWTTFADIEGNEFDLIAG